MFADGTKSMLKKEKEIEKKEEVFHLFIKNRIYFGKKPQKLIRVF